MPEIQPPMLVMTSNNTDWTLDGFTWLLNNYSLQPVTYIAGYRKPNVWCSGFLKLGEFKDFPRDRWSDSLILALQAMVRKGHEIIWLMLDDYWIIRGVDNAGLACLTSYMKERPDILKVDLTTDRLYAYAGQPWLYGRNTVDRVCHLDLIESPRESPYHMSLWGGLWNVNNLLNVLQPNMTAQEIEIVGTPMLAQTPYRVLGTRQAPVLHTNIIRGGGPPEYRGYNFDDMWVNGVRESDLEEMRRAGVEIR